MHKPLAMVSPDLLWMCTRNNNSFLRKRTNLKPMDAHPDNLTSLNAFKFSGLANKRPVGVYIQKKGKKETVVLSKAGKKRHRPNRARDLTALSTNEKKGLATIAKELGKKGYRADLTVLAQKKFVKLRNSFRKGREQRKPRRHLK